ncbi:hypothetical protein PS631_01326 [Pseudomonas fluorescens]|uniref:Uncharacterized protein n=1 Tax=Pseudomonas fluorescens TaxID=294 RepID=A0A5E6R2A0_PSEFL|nr:hypothetical protein PS631_01326 [Pseudomonas fluorescens]
MSLDNLRIIRIQSLSVSEHHRNFGLNSPETEGRATCKYEKAEEQHCLLVQPKWRVWICLCKVCTYSKRDAEDKLIELVGGFNLHHPKLI